MRHVVCCSISYTNLNRVTPSPFMIAMVQRHSMSRTWSMHVKDFRFHPFPWQDNGWFIKDSTLMSEGVVKAPYKGSWWSSWYFKQRCCFCCVLIQVCSSLAQVRSSVTVALWSVLGRLESTRTWYVDHKWFIRWLQCCVLSLSLRNASSCFWIFVLIGGLFCFETLSFQVYFPLVMFTSRLFYFWLT